MTIRPVPADPMLSPASGDHSSSGLRTPALASGLLTVLIGVVVLKLAMAVPGGGTIQRPWDSWLRIALPALALPAVLLWWTRSPGRTQRLLPVIVGGALLPVVLVALLPSVARTLPDALVTVLALMSSAASWTTNALLLICAVSLARAGRTGAASLAAALLVLLALMLPTVLGAMLQLSIPGWITPALVLVAALLLIAGGVSTPVAPDGPVSAAVAIATLLGAVAVVVPSVLTYFLATRSGPGSWTGWTAGIGAVLVLAAVGGAALLGRHALLLVLGAGLLVGSLFGLTSSVGAGLGRDWWLPLVVALVAAFAAAVSTARRAREIGLPAMALTVVVLVATFLVVEFGHLDEGLEILLTFAGLVAGAIAAGAIAGATVPRLVRSEELVPVLLLVLVLGSGVTRVLGWVFEATDTARNNSLLWISGVLVVAAVVTALWPTSRSTPPLAYPGDGSAGAVGPDPVWPSSDVTVPDHRPHGSGQPAPPAW